MRYFTPHDVPDRLIRIDVATGLSERLGPDPEWVQINELRGIVLDGANLHYDEIDEATGLLLEERLLALPAP